MDKIEFQVSGFIRKHHGQKLNMAVHKDRLSNLVASLVASNSTITQTKVITRKVNTTTQVQDKVGRAVTRERERCKAIVSHFVDEADPNSPRSIIARQILNEITSGAKHGHR